MNSAYKQSRDWTDRKQEAGFSPGRRDLGDGSAVLESVPLSVLFYFLTHTRTRTRTHTKDCV